MKVHNRAIDEVWYKRAVDYYKEDKEAYVYSVPFDAGQYISAPLLLKPYNVCVIICAWFVCYFRLKMTFFPYSHT